jgi:hypothetical protein
MNTKSVNMKLKDYLEYEKPLVCKFTKKYIWMLIKIII